MLAGLPAVEVEPVLELFQELPSVKGLVDEALKANGRRLGSVGQAMAKARK